MQMYNFMPKDNGIPLYVQLKQALIDDINNGKYSNMQKLPSRRELAKKLNVSTTTVNNAYQALVDDGYAITIDRSGFYVKSNAEIAEDYDDVRWESNQAFTYNMSYNSCETSNLSDTVLKHIKKQLSDIEPQSLYGHGDKRGEAEFRVALSKMLADMRGINCQISDIIVGAGLQYLLTIIVMILGRDKVYGFENPTDYKMYVWLKNLGVDIRFVNIDITSPVTPKRLDDVGIDVMFVMPENQLPTGYKTKLSERIALADWCSGKDKYVIEVATDGFLAYDNNRIDSLYTLSGGKNVIYLDSFNYTISANCRLSYILLPHGLIDEAIRRLEMYTPLVTVLEQKIYQKLLSGGSYDKLIRKNNTTMLDKRDYLISSIKSSSIGDRFKLINFDTGMNFIGVFESDTGGTELTQKALSAGVKIFEMSKFLMQPNPEIEKNAFVFGYAGLNKNDISNCVKILEKAWNCI